LVDWSLTALSIHRLPNKSSTADPLPTLLLKQVTDSSIYCTALQQVAGREAFPAVFKEAFITPIGLAKKPGLDDTDVSSYRPIFNLMDLSKLLEVTESDPFFSIFDAVREVAEHGPSKQHDAMPTSIRRAPRQWNSRLYDAVPTSFAHRPQGGLTSGRYSAASARRVHQDVGPT